MGILASLGAFLALITLIPPLHAPIKQLCRPVLWRWIPWQLHPVQWAQQLQHPLLEYAVLLSAATVTVEFYVCGLVILALCGMVNQVALLVALLGLIGHIVFRIKDLLESPRPADCIKAAPEHLRITIKDYSGDIEDGIPSAHCCGSVLLLLYAIHTASATGHLQPEAMLWAQLATAAWVVWIAYGRLYLGVHSPIDLVTGSMLGWCLLEVWVLVEQYYITWLVSSPYLPLQVVLASFLLVRCYPMPSRYTDTLNYAIAWLGGWAGVTVAYRYVHPAIEDAAGVDVFGQWGVVGSAVGNSIGMASDGLLGGQQGMNFSLQPWLNGLVPLVVVKVFVGLVLAGVAKLVVKQVSSAVLHFVFGLLPSWIRCLWQPPVVGRPAGGNGKQDYAATALQQPSQQHQRVLLHTKQHHLARSSEPDTVHMIVSIGRGASSSMWVLRHAPNGMAYDVIATAKFLSYAAVGCVVVLIDAWWQPLVAKLSYASSTV